MKWTLYAHYEMIMWETTVGMSISYMIHFFYVTRV